MYRTDDINVYNISEISRLFGMPYFGNRSTFDILVEEVVGHSSSTVNEVAKWERMEKEIGEHILDERRILEKFWDASEMDSKEEEEYEEYRIPSTG